jgi:hypothetical protein
MKKKSRIRWELAYASDHFVAGALRNAQLDKVEHKYNLSSAGVGGTRSLGQYSRGGDYWN